MPQILGVEGSARDRGITTIMNPAKGTGSDRLFAIYLNHAITLETVAPLLAYLGEDKCTLVVDDDSVLSTVEAERIRSSQMPSLEIIELSKAIEMRRAWRVGIATTHIGSMPRSSQAELRLVFRELQKSLIWWFALIRRMVLWLFLGSQSEEIRLETHTSHGATLSNYRSLARKNRPMRRLFQTSVKLEHGVYDVTGYNFGRVNEMFDAVLCHGPYSENRYRRGFGLRTTCVDYPKYATDSQREGPKQIAQVSKTNRRPIILWLPSLHEENSVESFAEEVASLSPDFDVYVKPHPMSPETQISTLRRAGVPEVPNHWPRDLPTLFQIADCTLHDAGGTGFAALYLNKLPLFLKIPDSIAFENGQKIPEKIAGEYFGEINRGELRFALERALDGQKKSSSLRSSQINFRRHFFSGGGSQDLVAGSIFIERLANESRLHANLLNSPIAKRARALFWNFRSSPLAIEGSG